MIPEMLLLAVPIITVACVIGILMSEGRPLIKLLNAVMMAYVGAMFFITLISISSYGEVEKEIINRSLYAISPSYVAMIITVIGELRVKVKRLCNTLATGFYALGAIIITFHWYNS